MVSVVNGLIEKHGGVQGIVSQLEQQGLGSTVKSWVGRERPGDHGGSGACGAWAGGDLGAGGEVLG